MLEKFDSKKVYFTPRGIAVYPKLVEAETKFNPVGVYSVRMKFSAADESILVDQLTSLSETAYALYCQKEFKTQLKCAPMPWKEGVDGRLLFSFKMTASGVDAYGKTWTRRPQIFDAKANEIEDPLGLRIGSGSEMIVMYRVLPFLTGAVGSGISLRLEGVRIFKLVDYKRDATFYGFEPEDGYEHTAASKKKTTTPIVEQPDLKYVPAGAAEDKEFAPVADTITDDDIPF